MLNETLENLEKDLKDSKTIKEYLITKIHYYDFLIYNLKQKIIKTKNLTSEQTKNISEQMNYYSNCLQIATKILSEIIELNLKYFEKEN